MEVDIKVNSEFVQRLSDLLEHKFHTGSAE